MSVILIIGFSCKKNDVSPFPDLTTDIQWDCQLTETELSSGSSYSYSYSDNKIKNIYYSLSNTSLIYSHLYYDNDSIIVNLTDEDDAIADKTFKYLLNNSGLAIMQFDSLRSLTGTTYDTTQYEYSPDGYLIKETLKRTFVPNAGTPNKLTFTAQYTVDNGNVVLINEDGAITKFTFTDTLNPVPKLYQYLGKGNKNLIRYKIIGTDTTRYQYTLNDNYPVKLSMITSSGSTTEENYSYDCH